jgi:hypothetical protein
LERLARQVLYPDYPASGLPLKRKFKKIKRKKKQKLKGNQMTMNDTALKVFIPEKFEPPEENRWEDYKIDLSKQIAPPEPLIIQTDSGIPMLHRRNIATIAASAKVGKTFLISAISAAALNDDCFLGFHCPKKDVRVLFVGKHLANPLNET